MDIRKLTLAGIVCSILHICPGQCTTIAFDGRTIASDSQMSSSHKSRGVKLFYCPEKKCWIGLAGTAHNFHNFLADFKQDKLTKKSVKQISALVVYQTGRCELYDESVSGPVIALPPQSIGSGKYAATIAMLGGSDAGKAVGVASQIDLWTGGDIYVANIATDTEAKIYAPSLDDALGIWSDSVYAVMFTDGTLQINPAHTNMPVPTVPTTDTPPAQKP